jgi:hypothetical protein
MTMGRARHRRARSFRTVAAVAAVVAVTLVALPAAGAAAAHPAAPAASWRPCGADNHRGAGWYDVIERGSNCHQARRLARRWWHANPTWGFACVIVDRRHGSGRVLCRRARDGALEQVRFSFS